MKLRLFRSVMANRYTVGRLYVDGKYHCDTLEDTDRRLEDNPGAKVYGKTAIPRGTYDVLITMSNRFKRELPLLKNVPGFEGIRIHPGNTHEDTDGCVLVGVLADSSDRMILSRATFNGLFKLLERAYDANDPIVMTVE
jgi:hypothetical protein